MLLTGMIQINVTDLSEARAFYGERLGIPIRDRFGPDGPFELGLGDGPPVLVYQVPKAVPVEYGEQTGVTLVLHTDDIEQTVATWQGRGVDLIPIPWSEDESGIAACPYGRFLAFRDPFGNALELLEPTSDPA